MKPVLRIGSYILLLVLGVVGGYYLGVGSEQARTMAFGMAESAYYSSYVDMQMSEGTDGAREEAIRTFLALTQKRREHRDPWISESMLAVDSALGNARLAALAQKRGAAQEAKQYLAQAQSYCAQMGWRECSAEKIAEVADRLDKKGLFGAGGSK